MKAHFYVKFKMKLDNLGNLSYKSIKNIEIESLRTDNEYENRMKINQNK